MKNNASFIPNGYILSAKLRNSNPQKHLSTASKRRIECPMTREQIRLNTILSKKIRFCNPGPSRIQRPNRSEDQNLGEWYEQIEGCRQIDNASG